MPAKPLTDRFIRALKPTPGQRLQFMDSEARGLCLRATSNGAVSWSFVYRAKGESLQRRLTIGDYPAWSLADARSKALALRKAVQDGSNPVLDAKRSRSDATLNDILDRYIERQAKGRLRSWREYQAALAKHVRPALGSFKARAIGRADIVRLLDGIADKTPIAANRVQSVLSAAFTWAVNEGLLDVHPTQGLTKRAVETAKDRTLTDAEIGRVWKATGVMAPAFRDALRLVLLTGQRPGECAGIEVGEVDVTDGVWTIPAARSKNKREHAVPLVGRAQALVEGLVAERRAGRLLVTPRGRALTAQNLAKAFERLPKGTLDAPATPHDLRRTAATLMARLGVDRLHVGAVLNHASTTRATVTGAVYDRHSYLAEKRRALTVLAGELDRIIEGREVTSNVTPMPRSAA